MIIHNLGLPATDTISRETISLAHIIRLPFHLCTGLLTAFDDPDDSSHLVWLVNRVSIPHTLSIPEANLLFGSSGAMMPADNDLWTNAVIVNRKPHIDEKSIDALRRNRPSEADLQLISTQSARLLNDVITAHSVIRPHQYVVLGGITSPRTLTQRELIHRQIAHAFLVHSPNEVATPDHIMQLMHKTSEVFTTDTGGFSGDWRAFTDDEISTLRSTVGRVRRHAFYELHHSAKTAMLQGDAVVAVVLACAALEGAHATYLRLRVRDYFPDKSSAFNDFMSKYLREQGFSAVIRFTFYVLMSDDQRPSDEDMELCYKGIAIRNKIMHAGIKATGRYEYRNYTEKQMNAGYRGIMQAFARFEESIRAAEHD